MPKAKELTPKQRVALLETLKERFDANMNRHAAIEWASVQARLESNGAKLWSLDEMEESGGEPDVVGVDKKTGECIFVDCSAQSPKGRRSVCYDREALDARKEHKPKNCAVDMATAMGAALLTEAEYRDLQTLVSSIHRRRVGCKLPLQFGSLAVRCSAIDDTTRYSSITMARSRTMRRGGSDARSRCSGRRLRLIVKFRNGPVSSCNPV
jgi:hypothetical protein